jgi:2'-5' RNA ligase
MPRLFIAVNCNNETRNKLISIRDCIKAQSVKGNFSQSENMHLTLAFLGETPEKQIPVICSVISEVATYPLVKAFTLEFSCAGSFKHGNKELWWVGVEHDNPSLDLLTDIRQRLTTGLSKNSIAFDNRSFNPHITLGREIKHTSPINLPEIKIVMPVNRISLMKSEHLGGKLVYTELFGQELV